MSDLKLHWAFFLSILNSIAIFICHIKAAFRPRLKQQFLVETQFYSPRFKKLIFQNGFARNSKKTSLSAPDLLKILRRENKEFFGSCWMYTSDRLCRLPPLIPSNFQSQKTNSIKNEFGKNAFVTQRLKKQVA
jgi:hypothetical protein